jgi:hypothetical protein
MRGGARLKVVTNDMTEPDHEFVDIEPPSAEPTALSAEARHAIARIRRELEQLLTMLKQSDINTP